MRFSREAHNYPPDIYWRGLSADKVIEGYKYRSPILVSAKMDKGVVYIATGEKYLEEAIESATSLKRYNDLPIALFSDVECEHGVFDTTRVLDSVRHDPGDSIPSFDQLPYERTLFLDSDTYICTNIEEVFEPLDFFDLGVTVNENLTKDYGTLSTEKEFDLPETPSSFYEFNTGVIVIRKSDEVKTLLNNWEELYRNQVDMSRNQIAFRQCLYDSDIRLFPLPQEYNLRIPYLAKIDREVKIIHGRHPSSFKKLEQCINNKSERRVITKKGWPMGIVTEDDVSLQFKLRYNIANEGILGTFKKLCGKIQNEM